MKIIVDADACPVKAEIIKIAKKHDIEVIMVCDTAHVISDDYSKVITVDKGSDSADFKIINISKPGDIIVTGDYGVAAMALSKGARTLGNSGVIYTNFNIDSFLAQRHLAKENRRKGGRFTNIKKRTSEENINFTGSLIKLIHSK
ncbi:MAG: YaiI/YqxD family protein [Clostridia bacterium]|nr:YaiI/YqxD family protein [Clostridia bacterium]